MFASPDSLVQYAYSPQALNRYSYVLNNPLTYTDPTGHRACEGPMGERWYTDPDVGTMPVQGWQPEPQPIDRRVPLGDTVGSSDPHADRAAEVLVDYAAEYGTPTYAEVLAIIIQSEIPLSLPSPRLNETLEALGRTMSQLCGAGVARGYCPSSEFSTFLGTYEGWFSRDADGLAQLLETAGQNPAMDEYVEYAFSFAASGGYAPDRPAHWWGPSENYLNPTTPSGYHAQPDPGVLQMGGAGSLDVMWSYGVPGGVFELYTAHQHCYQVVGCGNPQPGQCAPSPANPQ